jgi:hypothetical protein
MLREGLVICPQTNNHGLPLTKLRDEAAIDLAKTFGGCTIVEAHGAWINPDGKLYSEPVWQLIAAYDPNNVDGDEALKAVARKIGIEGEQEAVYIRRASGDVEIMNTRQLH